MLILVILFSLSKTNVPVVTFSARDKQQKKKKKKTETKLSKNKKVENCHVNSW